MAIITAKVIINISIALIILLIAFALFSLSFMFLQKDIIPISVLIEEYKNITVKINFKIKLKMYMKELISININNT